MQTMVAVWRLIASIGSICSLHKLPIKASLSYMEKVGIDEKKRGIDEKKRSKLKLS